MNRKIIYCISPPEKKDVVPVLGLESGNSDWIKFKVDMHTLAKQMGTSIQMLEKHYSHLTPRLRKDVLTR